MGQMASMFFNKGKRWTFSKVLLGTPAHCVCGSSISLHASQCGFASWVCDNSTQMFSSFSLWTVLILLCGVSVKYLWARWARTCCGGHGTNKTLQVMGTVSWCSVNQCFFCLHFTYLWTASVLPGLHCLKQQSPAVVFCSSVLVVAFESKTFRLPWAL